MGLYDYLGTAPGQDELQQARIWATQNGIMNPGYDLLDQYRRAQQVTANKAAFMTDMENEVKAFTSTDPATRATAPNAGLGSTTAGLGLSASDPYKIKPREMTDADRAREAAAVAQHRTDQLYNQVNGMQSALTPDVAAGLARNTFNTPYLQTNGTERAGLNAQNGGGHMGAYGDAAGEAIRAGADVQRDMGLAQLAGDLGKYQDTFNTNKANLLNSIKNGDPSYANYDNLYSQATNFANQDRAFNQGLAQQADTNRSQFASGLLGAAGTVLSNPTAMAGLSSVAGPIGTGVGLAASAIYNGLSGAMTKPTTPPPAQYNPNATASAPRYGLASVPGNLNNPILGNVQPKRFGLFGGT